MTHDTRLEINELTDELARAIVPLCRGHSDGVTLSALLNVLIKLIMQSGSATSSEAVQTLIQNLQRAQKNNAN